MVAELQLTYHIRRWRLRRHLSQAVLGRHIGVTRATLSAYERGQVDIPTLHLCRLALALHVTLDALVTARPTSVPVPRAEGSSLPAPRAYKPIPIVTLKVVRRRHLWAKHPPVTTPAFAARLVRDYIDDPDREWLLALLLDEQHQLTAIHPVAIGKGQYARVEPREVLTMALLHRAYAVILCHNHPSRAATPSPQDLEATSQLREAGRLVGVTLWDHLILAPPRHVFSFRRSGLLG
jgi:DNA repair protein RadC